jgi:hypothetical protein
MPDDRAGSPAGSVPAPQIPVSPNNPCPFLRALVAGGYVDGHIVPLPKLTRTIEAATGKTGLKKRLAGLEIYPVALVANGLSPFRLVRSWWSGAVLDELRNGPLDKHGVGSRILNAEGQVDETEIARLAEFGRDRPDPCGGTERGLTSPEITTYMNANFARAKDTRRWYDRLLMNGEWPVLLNVMGKGEGKERYLSVSEVRTLFVERRLPERIVARLSSQPLTARSGPLRRLGKAAIWIIAIGFGAIVAIAEFPNQVGAIVPPLAQLLPPHYRSPRRLKRRAGLTRTGRPRTGTGSIMQARAPGLSLCHTPGLSRSNNRAFICSPGPVCFGTAAIWNGSVFCPARKRSIPMQQACVALAISRPTPRRRRRRRRSRVCDRRWQRISTACPSVSRG